MTYLELCRKVHLLLRVGDEAPGSQPTQLAGNSGPVAEVIQWVAEAYRDIQRLHDNWMFRLREGSFTVSAGQRIVTPTQLREVSNLGAEYDVIEPFAGDAYAYLLTTPVLDPNNAEQEVRYLSYQKFFGYYDQKPISIGQPQFFTIDPSGNVVFDTEPDRAYSIRTFFRLRLQEFADGDAQPIWPVQFDDVLIYWVIVHYYCLTRDGTQQLRDKSDLILRRELIKMRNRQLPSFSA